MRRFSNQNGINYIQMLLVIVIGGILGALVVPHLLNKERDELLDEARMKIDRIGDIEFEYYKTHGEFTMELDSLMTLEPDSTTFIDPLTGKRFVIGVVNQGQDFSIRSDAEPSLLLVTEDRWDELLPARQAWHDYSQQLREASRRGRGL